MSDTWSRWQYLKKQLDLDVEKHVPADPETCDHPRDQRGGVGDLDMEGDGPGQQLVEWCLQCESELPQELWVLWKDDENE